VADNYARLHSTRRIYIYIRDSTKSVATQQPRSQPSGLLSEAYCKNGVYKTSSKDVDELRRRISVEWDKLDQRIIDKAVGERQKRLQACVAAVGGHFEHNM